MKNLKIISPILLTFLISTSCSKESGHKENLNSEVSILAEKQANNKQEIKDELERKLDVLAIKSLILKSDSIYLLIGETKPGKVPLPISEKLTERNDIEQLLAFIPKDTATIQTRVSMDTVFITNPPPPRYGMPIGTLRIYKDSLHIVWIDIVIDSSDTFFYMNSYERKKAFTKEGDAFFRRKYWEYKSLQKNPNHINEF